MIHFSLFSGIGGFEIASEWAGWNNYLSCDINEFGNKILNYYWPDAYHHKDIHTLNHHVIHDELTRRYGSDWRTDDIILTGGFPCQPYSSAGKRLGKEDDRHLWPEMLRVIREIKPTWVVGENVLGLVNWNDGLVFNEVQADLEAEGYEVQAFVLPAASVNAPHKRDRVWFVAYSKSQGSRKQQSKNTRWQNRRSNNNGTISNASDTNSDGMQRHTVNIRAGQEDGQRRQSTEKTWNHEPIRAWQNFPTQSPICGGDDGLPTELDGITFPKWRNESIKAYGNAIVPQVAYQIFKAINEYKEMYE
jgi:DNA (cytosine-5)-methyltransferase 1